MIWLIIGISSKLNWSKKKSENFFNDVPFLDTTDDTTPNKLVEVIANQYFVSEYMYYEKMAKFLVAIMEEICKKEKRGATHMLPLPQI